MKFLVLLTALMTTFATAAGASEMVELRTQLIAEVRESIGTRDRPAYRMVPARRLAQGQEVY